jgi:CheY-like chemotaxis protein
MRLPVGCGLSNARQTTASTGRTSGVAWLDSSAETLRAARRGGHAVRPSRNFDSEHVNCAPHTEKIASWPKSATSRRTRMTANERSLRGKKILIVEDEFLVGELLQRLLLRAGAEVIGPINDAAQAVAIARDQSISGALLDVELNANATSVEVAEILTRRQIPFIVTSVHSMDMLPAPLRGGMYLGKPILPDVLLHLMETVF